MNIKIQGWLDGWINASMLCQSYEWICQFINSSIPQFINSSTQQFTNSPVFQFTNASSESLMNVIVNVEERRTRVRVQCAHGSVQENGVRFPGKGTTSDTVLLGFLRCRSQTASQYETDLQKERHWKTIENRGLWTFFTSLTRAYCTEVKGKQNGCVLMLEPCKNTMYI